jgi:hypothetical protein
MKAETWYRGEEAVAAGLADEVVPIPKRGAEPGQAEPGEDEPGPEMRKQFDLTAYGYTGPAKTEPPTPPPAADEAQPTLVISIADVLDEDTVARLRAAFQAPAVEPEPAAVAPEPVVEPEVPAVPAPVAAIEPAPPETAGVEPEPIDDWTAMVSSLIPTDDADDWSALVSHLTEPEASSSAATAA